MRTPVNRASAALLALLSSAALLAGCDRDDQRTAGQKVDQAIAATERTAAVIKSETREAGRDVQQAVGAAADSAANTARDVAITAEINARLARDEQLSALRINVDTSGGQVMLRGSAPNAAARDRATELARAVDGVVNVNNELSVQPRS